METYKIIRVLEFINEYCKEKDRCDGCPFYDADDYECYLLKEGRVVYPSQWDIGIIKEKLKHKERLD